MNCYFCNYNLIEQEEINLKPIQKHYFCKNEFCHIYGMPRHKVIITSDIKTYEYILLDKFYIQFDYIKNITAISKLDVVILSNTIYINKILHFNFKDIDNTASRIKNILIFS